MPHPHCDILIRNGQVIDGTGTPARAADVALTGDRIAAIGPALPHHAGRVIDAGGQAVASGFIDVHTHDDRALLSHPDMPFKVSQGVTTLVAGNCGVSLAPLVLEGQPPPPLDLLGYDAGWFRFDRFADFVTALHDAPPAVNAGLLVGHITLRHRVMDRLDRAATPDETAPWPTWWIRRWPKGPSAFPPASTIRRACSPRLPRCWRWRRAWRRSAAA